MADITISGLSPITPTTGLFLPASNSTTNTTGKVTLAQVCGVMTSAQIVAALGYTPLSELPIGSVAQVIQGVTSTPVAIATTQTNTGLTASITMAKSTNKVLVMNNVLVQVGAAYQNTKSASIGLLRNGVRVAGTADAAAGVLISTQTSSTSWSNYCTFNYLDAPGAGTHVYSVVMREIASGTITAQIGNQPSYMTLMEIVG